MINAEAPARGLGHSWCFATRLARAQPKRLGADYGPAHINKHDIMMHVCVYIYIYTSRHIDRERERERNTYYMCIYIYIYI